MLTSAAVLEARFTVTKFREGYDQGEVTEFLQRASAALAAVEAGAGTGAAASVGAALTADEVAQTRFATTKFDNGFDQDEVEVLLEAIAAALREYAAAAVAEPVEAPPALIASSSIPDKTFTRTRFRAGFSPAGVDGFLAAVRPVIAAYEQPDLHTGLHTRRQPGLHTDSPADSSTDAPALASADIVNVRFKPTSWRSGYNQDEVADYLTQIITTLAYYERVAGAQ